MSTEINFTGTSNNDDSTRVDLNLPRKILTTSTGRALTSGVQAVTEAESCSYNALLDLDRKRLLHEASLVLLPSTYGEGRLFSQKPVYNSNGEFTATRATTATRVNSAGLVDLVPYNLVQYSEQFDNAAWHKLGIGGAIAPIVTSNAGTAPDGTLTAERVQFDCVGTTSTFRSLIGQGGISTVINSRYTQSLYVKAFSPSEVGKQLRIVSEGTNNSSIITITADWQRITINGTPAIFTSSNFNIETRGSFTTNTTADVLLWGAQLVEGTSARDYLRTETRLNIPRIDYSLGSCPNILLEPQRTNSILNSSMVGAVAGSPGTAPTGWTFNGGGGLVRTISLGTENGLPYIDVRFQGVATQTFVSILPNPTTSASAAQNWNFSLYAKLVSGTLPSPRINILASGGSNQSQDITLTSSFQRFDITFLNLPTGTTNVRPYLSSTLLSIGTAYDFTIRIAAPQLEQGAYATSYIPTTSATVTRNTDSITRNNIFTNGLITSSGGTWFVELRNNIPLLRDSATRGIFINTGISPSIGDGITIRNLGGVVRNQIVKVISGTTTTIYTTTSNTSKIAIKWNGTTADVFENGVKVVSATAFTPTAMQNLICNADGLTLNINEIALFPTALTDAQCIALTQ